MGGYLGLDVKGVGVPIRFQMYSTVMNQISRICLYFMLNKKANQNYVRNEHIKSSEIAKKKNE